MYKLIAATLAGLYVVTTVFGEPAEAAMKKDAAQVGQAGFSLASFIIPASLAIEETPLERPDRLSEGEAIEMALAAGRELRESRKSTPDLRGLIAAVEQDVDVDAVQAEIDAAWFVTGDSVNLREGPSTSNGVIGRVSLGQPAEVLSDTSGDWIRIRTADGTDGWIYGKYLSAERPS